MGKKLTSLRKLLSKYVDTRIVFVFDIVISFVSSTMVVLIADIALSVEGRANHFYLWWLCASLISTIIMFAVIRTHRVIIRHFNFKDLVKFLMAVFGKEALLAFALVCAGFTGKHLHILVLLGMDFLLTFFCLTVVRLLMIVAYDAFEGRFRKNVRWESLVVFGAGSKAAAMVTRLQNSYHYSIKCFISPDKNASGKSLADRKVYYCPDKEHLAALTEKLGEFSLLFPIEDDLRDQKDHLVKYATELGIKVQVAPSIDTDNSGQNKIREVKIEDLLGRDEIRISMNLIKENFHNKVVLVTGAAGSIGSELCRQLAGLGVRQLVLFDNGETPMHNLRLSLEEKYPALNFTPVIGDVRQESRLDFVFRKFRPQVVFHAAAYKHVPLMEENPCEAVLVNVAGTKHVADKCIEYGVEKMVMISTDKAVNPTNVMGCSKRLAEIYVQSLGNALARGEVQGQTRFVTTRFGNVLGSNGSVIPRFREQIAKGGPVTVTHPDITRFFMTIPEACRLVMEAATISKGNEIFVFDMGESVKIDFLARKMIQLAGFKPDEDIKVVYSGLRPGEKLYEEVLSDKENTIPTSHERIRVAKVRDYSYSDAVKAVRDLRDFADAVQIEQMVSLMKKVVPEFKSKNSVFEALDK